MKGKSWYKVRHFIHDGLICGYNREEKTYCIYAYDSNWLCQKFWMPQKCFDNARHAAIQEGAYGYIFGLKPKQYTVEFSPKSACESIKGYLDSSFEKYPKDAEGPVHGIVVQAYIADYIDRLHEGFIPYERMDWRVFRLIWEHKKFMLERIQRIEQCLQLGTELSEKYKELVEEADNMRMLYAAYHAKRRDSLLPIIKKKLLQLMEKEKALLTKLVERVDKII
jgi:hypothetical protein